MIVPGRANPGSREKMTQVPSANTLGAQLMPIPEHIPFDTRAGERSVVDETVFPSSASPGRPELMLALAAVLVSAAIFMIAAPFAREPLPPMWAFIPAYESALALSDLLTAVLLFAQFSIPTSAY